MGKKNVAWNLTLYRTSEKAKLFLKDSVSSNVFMILIFDINFVLPVQKLIKIKQEKAKMGL